MSEKSEGVNDGEFLTQDMIRGKKLYKNAMQKMRKKYFLTIKN